MNEDDLLPEIPPEFDRPTTRDADTPAWLGPGIERFFACPIGTALWEKFRTLHPEAPERPPCMQELSPDPDAAAYFEHASTCPFCLED